MKRGEALAQQVNESLWDNASQLYINKISTSLAFYPRLSPTSFYPLLAGIASDEQALAMMEHLTNTSEFCVNKVCVSARRKEKNKEGERMKEITRGGEGEIVKRTLVYLFIIYVTNL